MNSGDRSNYLIIIINFICITMKLSILLLASLLSSQIVFSQNSPRKILDFDHGWEMYCMTDTTPLQSENVSKRGTSFLSQFNDQHVAKHKQSVDAVISSEIAEVQKGFSLEYSNINLHTLFYRGCQDHHRSYRLSV